MGWLGNGVLVLFFFRGFWLRGLGRIWGIGSYALLVHASSGH
jgi:hypothetical protein